MLGGNKYRIILPPKVPVANFWSVDGLRRVKCLGAGQWPGFPLIRFARQACAERRREHRPVPRPESTRGKAGNWLATVPGKGYFTILRLYGPTEAALDKSWKPGDIVKTE